MRYVGIMLVALAGSGLGLYHSRRLYRRVDWLRRMEALLDAMAGRLSYTAEPMAQLWHRLYESEAFGSFSLVQDTVAGMEHEPFAAAFAAATERAVRLAALLPEDRCLLEEFGVGCGHSGLTEQLTHIRAARERFSRAREQAEARAAARGQVYQMMGVAGGVGLALLLL